MSQQLTEYFKNVNPILCQNSSGNFSKFLESKENYIYTCRVIILITLPLQLFTFYCILKKTPKVMDSVKSSLLNLNFWYTFCGIYYSFLSIPYFFHPHRAGFFIGILSDLGIPNEFQCFLQVMTSYLMVLAFLILFENRSSLIVNNIFRFKSNSKRNLWIVFNCIGCMGPFVPVYFNFPDSNEARIVLLKVFPCPPQYFFTENILIFPTDGFWYTYLSAISLFSNGILFFQFLFFPICCLYYLFYAKSSQVSPETRRLQIRSFFGIVLQTTIPFLLVLIPMFSLSMKTNPEKFDQSNTNFTFLPLVLHKGIASLCIILVHYPYRTFLFSVICCKKQNDNKITTVPISISMKA